MTNLLKTAALATILLASTSTAHAQVSFGIHIGEPPAPRTYRVAPRPGPEYVWVEGYNYPEGGRYKWHDGYWTRPPYEGAYWVEPYHYGGMYYTGRWEGSRAPINYNHGCDRNRDRDDRHGR